MNFEYTYPKKTFDKKNIHFMYLFFDNGDYLSLQRSEIIDIKVNTYDRLVWENCGACPFAESGYIKLKVKRKNTAIYNGCFLYDIKDYRKDRKGYIENRCVNDGGIKFVRLFDRNNWHDTIKGNIVAELDGEFLILKFLNQPNLGSASSDKNVIFLNDIVRSVIDNIYLDFENCESFTIYKNEIEDIQLEFESELEWGAGELYRKVKGGFIKLRLDKEINFRQVDFIFTHRASVKQLEEKLCSKKGQDEHIICHLYIEYDYAGFGERRKECIGIPDMRPDEELERLEKLMEEYEWEYDFADFIGGLCKKLKDGTIIIAFGKNASDYLNV